MPNLYAHSASVQEAVLAGHALLPAESFVAAPADAPHNLHYSGKFTGAERIDEPGTLEGHSAQRPTGVFLPFKGQPLQGHSGIKKMADGSYWILTDNGAGSKANSADFMLYLSRYRIDFKQGNFEPLERIFLHDPNKKVPFPIVNEATDMRYLTGADFDPESFQIIGDTLWIGDEFGPYLIKANLKGKVLQVFATKAANKIIRSPDNHSLKMPGAPTDAVPEFEAKRSKGFEGMAASKDGKKLYPLLEGSLWDTEQQVYENDKGKNYLRILEFDLDTEQWSGNFWKYPLENNANAIGDFNMIDEQRALVIERDNGEGVVEKACASGEQDKTACFADLPKFKRVYLIRFNRDNQGQNVEKLAYVDLLNIQDPNQLARKPLSEGRFKFPFFTIENVDLVDEKHIIVGNDNNLPYSSSREPNKADDNELILLNVESMLKIK
ncbi:esterase-like activity of phytase family protein [Mesocricetibacter intestinalis]|nr:esterase-like activity of phytase family protein [Mesocricetibacter intestinalis]